MDVESIREIVSVFRELGGEAKEAFIWYLVVAYLPGYALGASALGIVYYAVSRAFGIWRSYFAGEALRKAGGYEEASCGGWRREHDIEDACEKLRGKK